MIPLCLSNSVSMFMRVNPAVWCFMAFSVLIPFYGMVSMHTVFFFLMLKPFAVILHAVMVQTNQRPSLTS